MKKILLLLVIGLFFLGCGTPAQRADFKAHDTMFASWDHLKFSARGFRNPTLQDAEKSDAQNWWGEPIEVPFGLK